MYNQNKRVTTASRVTVSRVTVSRATAAHMHWQLHPRCLDSTLDMCTGALF